MVPPIGGLLLAWSHSRGQASDNDWTSDESETEEGSSVDGGVKDSTFWTRDELLDGISQEVLNVPESKLDSKVHVSKAEALDMVKIKKLRPVEAARQLLMQITGESLETMSEIDERRLLFEVDSLARKIRRVVSDDKARKFRFEPELLEDTLASFSQNSFVSKVREEEDEIEEESSMEIEQEEETKEVTKEKVYRKGLNKLGDKDTMKRRTDNILNTVREEANRQGVTTTELLAYLIYRENYPGGVASSDLKLANFMLDLFKGGKMKENKVSEMDTLAMVLRGHFGRTTYHYVRRLLKPYRVSFPSWCTLAKLRQLLTPKLVPFLYYGRVLGTCVGLQDCLRLHLQRLVQTNQASFLATVKSSLVCNITIGVDGRGTEKVRGFYLNLNLLKS